MDRAEQQEMQDAFEKSRHYFQGDGPAERTVAWSVWRDAWNACWPLARAAIYSAEQAQIDAPLRARLAKAEHWAKHAMLMRSSQNEELLRILRGED